MNKRRFGLVVALICFWCIGLPITAQAQQSLTYGDALTGTLSATAPVQVYNFSGEAGDLVTLQVMSLTTGLQPALSIIAPDGQPLPVTTLALGSVSQYNAQLTGTGVHTVLITAGNGGTGDFALTLGGQPASATIALTEDGGQAPLINGQTLTVPPADVDRQLVAQSSPPVAFTATLSGGDADLLTLQSSGNAGVATFALPASTSAYTLSITTASTVDSTLSITLTDTAATPTPTEIPPTAPAVPTQPTAAPGECLATPNNGVNVRSGPGTDFAPIGAIVARTTVPVLGINADNDWYYVQLPNGTQGWAYSEILALQGDCDDLPTVLPENPLIDESTATPTVTVTPTAPADTGDEPTATPTQVSDAPTATHTPSYTPTQDTGGDPTATYTPSHTPTVVQDQPTVTYTPSYTPTEAAAAQIAPDDARFNNPLTIPLDNTASVLDFVSYPGGDNEDRVRWDITGMNQVTTSSGGRARLVIAVSCFGENTDQIQFFTGGQTYSCGQTIVDEEVTFNSKTGSVVITAVGGEGTYVQWVLTGTATRVN